MNAYFWGVVSFLILQWIAAIGRIYVRLFMVRNWGWDDWAMVAVLLFSTAFDAQALAISLVSGVMTLEELLIWHQARLYTAARMVLAVDCTYIVAATLLKVALALLLLRVLLAKWQRITIYITLTICIVYGVFYFCLILFECGNPANFDDHVITQGFCIPKSLILGTSYAHAVVNAIADCIFGALPVHFLYKSNLNLRAKLSVGAILVLGSVGCVCTLIRIGWIHYLVSLIGTYFISAQGICLMSAAELSIGVTCICLATYKPLMRRALGLQSSDYYYYGTENNYVTRPTSEASQMAVIPRETNTASTDKTLQQQGDGWPLKTTTTNHEEEVDTLESPTYRSTFSEHSDVAANGGAGGGWESDGTIEITQPASVLTPTRQSHWHDQRVASPPLSPTTHAQSNHIRNSSSRTYISGRDSQATTRNVSSAARRSQPTPPPPEAVRQPSFTEIPSDSQEQLTALPRSPSRPQGRWGR